jgi:flagellar FliL protein
MMADNKAAAKDAAGAKGEKGDASQKPEGKKRNPKRMIIIALAAVLLAGLGAAAYFLLLRPAPAEAQADAGKAQPGEKGKDRKGEPRKPFFVEFETFTVNMKDPEKFLQIKLIFQVGTVNTAEALKEFMPVVRSAVIPVLGMQDPAELMTPEGKEKLSAALTEAANKSLAGGELENAVETVLITHMIIQ